MQITTFNTKKHDNTLPSLTFCVICLIALNVFFPKTGLSAENETPEIKKIEINKYGIDCESSQIIQNVVRRNESLSDILLANNVPYSVIHSLASKSKDVFDVRSIRAGNPYCIIKDADSSEDASYMVYEQNSVDYVVFDMDDTKAVDVYNGRKDVEIRNRKIAGVIDSSLWNALKGEQHRYELAVKLAELYAWTIDFYHLQKDTRFQVIFEEKFVNGKAVGMRNILAARLTSHGEDYYAFYYEQDGRDGRYFDEDGRSLQKAFLKAPVKYSSITSGYTTKRFHPILHRYRAHLGIDYAAPKGTPITSVGDGVILKAQYNRGKGRFVKIRHNGTYATEYFHMTRFASNIKPGTRVYQGDVIGYVGSTGLATGPHVCFRFWKNGKQVNFIKEDIPSAVPVKKGFIDDFCFEVALFRNELDDIRLAQDNSDGQYLVESLDDTNSTIASHNLSFIEKLGNN
ncbi:peptidoglycan DD-metalloendopeptidase family protein [Desulfobacterales bacterium HSG16]|nr:peptidoglycan DD-metalloendopeptidase family protein [Desulfobacterales bacterium HSG16]